MKVSLLADGRRARTSPTGTNDDFTLWLALAAGEAAWADSNDPVLPINRLGAAIALVGYAGASAICWTGYLMRDDASGFAHVAPWTASAALGLVAIRPLRLVLGHRRTVQLWPSAALRLFLTIVIVASIMPNTPFFGWLSIWPFAIALGAESGMVAWETGIDVDPRSWWIAFVRSPLHLGVIGASLAAIVNLGLSRTLQVALPVYLVVHGSIFVGAATAALLDRNRKDSVEREERLVRAAAAAEHRKSAHWLHDDVSSELKLVQLKLQNQQMSSGQLADELGHLDHKLRLRQLDELFQSGTVRVAEVIQPFVRTAQSFGTTITSVPTFDDAADIVDERVGRLVARAASVVVNNAIVAGATELGFRVKTDAQQIQLTITDNAGGFSLAEAPAGRALWQLGQEIGTGKIFVNPIDGGSAVNVTIDRREMRWK
jgi:signal transduction histidine kinase